MPFQFPTLLITRVSTFLFILPFFFLAGCLIPAPTVSSPPVASEGPIAEMQAENVSVTDSTLTDAPVSRKALLEEQAYLWQGTPHRFGGTSRSGIDCSALVQNIFDETFNMYLPRTTAEQVNVGKRIATSELQAGDLVFYRINARTRHVGIYVDDDTFLHASKSEGVAISSMHDAYWKRRFWMARRVLDLDSDETPSSTETSNPDNVQVKW